MSPTLDFRLALRNLLRNRRRSITTLLALIVGVCAILLFGGYSKDITYGLQTDFVQRSGHLQIQRQGYFLRGSGNSSAYGIPDYDALIARVRQDPQLAPMLVVVTPTLQLGGIAGNFPAGISRTVMVHGMQAQEQSRMRLWNDYGFPVQPKPVALAGTPENAIVVGQGVARVLHLCEALKVPDCDDGEAAPAAAASAPGGETPDDIAALTQLEAAAAPQAAAGGTQIEILAASTHGAPNVGSFNVASAELQGVKELDDVHVAMHLPRAQRLVYGSERPQVTAILVQLKHTSQMPAAQARLRELLDASPGGRQLEILDFATLNPFYEQTNRMFGAIFGFVFVLIGVIVLFIVSNTMSMSIVERTIEIGTLRAIGTRRAGIQGLFLCEGLLLGLAGAALGVLVALAVGWVINRSGLTWMPPARVDAVPLTVRVWGEWAQIAGAFAGLVLVAAVSAWLPARRAARMHIVDALRHA
ncbi:FtsX-like permease family protein [Aquincola sp. MAHUQ-54]|uniref:FtsX-like permease family protein n=1 Tax=Aquincola agrisoli TaxID=3119538 RepID=A0AAW9QGZ6_9BURK